MVKQRNSVIIWLGIALILLGLGIDVFTSSLVVGTAIIVVGVLLVALQAGRGNSKGGEQDH